MKCTKCVNCESIIYLKPIHVVYECRQADIRLSSKQLAKGCKCFELEEVAK